MYKRQIQWCDQYGTSIPENEEKLKKLERECRNAGIRIHALPDINGSDGLTQYAVATDDFKHFQTIYKDFLLNDIPVSYTHLDVYKRQAVWPLCCLLWCWSERSLCV